MSAARILDMKGHLVFSVGETAPLTAVVDALATHGIGALVVTDASHDPVGIISERDVIRTIARDVNAMKRTASDVMTRHVLTCSPGETAADLAARMSKAGIRHLPVESSGQIVGLVSARDVMGRHAEARSGAEG